MEGPLLTTGFESFVGLRPIPMRHALTIGELARHFVRTSGLDVRLEIVPVAHWSRDMLWHDLGRAWVPTSPNLPRFEGGSLDQSDVIPRNVFVLDGNDCSIRALEGQLVGKVLEATQWNISRAASLLGINRTTLYNKIRLYELGKRPMRSKVMV